MKRILLVKTSSLGDIVQAFPVVEYLKKRLPLVEIDWVVEESYAELLRAHPDITRTLTVNTRVWRKKFWTSDVWKKIQQFRRLLQTENYDCVFDLQGNIKSGLITWLTRSPHKVGFGWKTAPERPNCLFTNRRYNIPKGHNIREDYLSLVQQFFRNNSTHIPEGVALHISETEQVPLTKMLSTLKHPLYLVCPGSMWRNKQLPVETWIAFLKKIHTATPCHFLISWGTAAEKETALAIQHQLGSNVQLLNKLSLPALQGLMSQVTSVIAVDSLPLHLAATTPISTFSIFGPSSSQKYRPLGPQHQSIQGPCPYGRTFEKRCPLLRTCSTGSCIRDLTADTLFDAWNRI